MMDIRPSIFQLIDQIMEGRVEIYNEISAQLELGIILRNNLPGMKIQFERPVNYFGFEKKKYEKREIDISIFSSDRNRRHAIEIKYPRNGQYPEMMFKSCQDIYFLEQLVSAGFGDCYFIMFADDPLFYERGTKEKIYRFFRAGIPINGEIWKPTGAKNEVVNILGSYAVKWKSIMGSLKFFYLSINKDNL